MAEARNYYYLRFALCDLLGRSRGRIVPVRYADRVLRNGTTIFGGTIAFGPKNEEVPVFSDDPMLRYVQKGNASPDLDTLHKVPWIGGRKVKVVEVLCESYWLKDGSHQLACPRYVARQQLQNLADVGYDLLSSFEIEFMLLHATTQTQPSYMDNRIVSLHSDFLLDLEQKMNLAGVDIEGIHTEHGISMFEAILMPTYGIKSSDQTFVFKTGACELADKSPYDLQFQSPTQTDTVGLHFNHSLWSRTEKKNAFQDLSDSEGFSEMAKHWIAGIMTHARALTALFCPTVDCYTRFHKMFPSGSIIWNFVDRKASLVAKTSGSDKGPYLENRIPSGVSNPYLVLAGTVAAGLDGILKKSQCPPPGTEAAKLPLTLQEAVQELQSDVDMVDRLGSEFVDWFSSTVLHDTQEQEETTLPSYLTVDD